jgi:hypothetical protein
MFKVIPNFLPQQEFDSGVGRVIHDPSIPWFWVRGTSDIKRDFDDNAHWDHSFAHTAYEFGEPTSFLGIKCEEILKQACSKLDLKLKYILRIRLGLITKTPEPVEHGGHLDFKKPHMTALYYLTTCNGPTIFYNEKWQEGVTHSTLTEARRVPAEQNKLLVFDGTTYHSSISQTDTKQRIAINFNFEVE